MKTISITYLEALRLTMLLKAQTGQRKDTKIRICRDVCRRIGLTQVQIDASARPVGNDRLMLNLEEIAKHESIDIQITPTEASEVLKILDTVQASIDDLDTWVESLATTLEGASRPE